MPNVTSVTITAGVPTAGSGTVSTIDALMADGGQATLGAQADAVVAAGAAGTIGAKLRAISRDLVANIVLAVGSNIIGKVGIDQTTPGTTDSVTMATGQGAGATIGTTSGAKVVTDANGTLQQYLRGLVTLTFAKGTLAAPSTDVMSVIPPAMTSVNANFNRASNTTTYTANDLVNASASGATGATVSWSIPAGKGVLRRVDVRHNATGSTGFNNSTFRVWLFNASITPTASVGDNDAFSEPLASAIGFVDVVVNNAGTDVVKAWANCDIPFVAGTLFGLVQILTGWTTPTASATFNIDLEYLPG